MTRTANLCTEIMDFRGFDSSMILILRAGIPRPIAKFPEILRQGIFVGVILVGRLGVRFFDGVKQLLCRMPLLSGISGIGFLSDRLQAALSRF